MNQPKDKVIVILGPTASGKSDAVIKLARKFDGEIISADSRQIYRGMDIGTGKVTGRLRPVIPSKRSVSKGLVFMSAGVPHHMIDIVSPKTDYNAAKFKKRAEKIIEDILKRGKLPIICGGTGFWIKSLVDNIQFPEVKPDWKLREKLNQKSTEKLFEMLKRLDPQRAKTIDKHNKIRIIRAIEIAGTIGCVPKQKPQDAKYNFLQIGISIPKEKLHKNIKIRMEKRFRQGMIAEVERLHKQGASWKRLESFGLEYRWIALYLQNRISREKMKENLYRAIKDYAKRQMTWFRKDKRIVWLSDYQKIEKEMKNFLR